MEEVGTTAEGPLNTPNLCWQAYQEQKGTWTFPGGHLDFGESLFGCAERETLEESGLVVRGVNVLGVTNDFFVENSLHYITVWVRCERVDDKQQPQVRGNAPIPSLWANDCEHY